MAEDTQKKYKFTYANVVLPKGTARFPSVHKPDSYGGNDPKFKLTIVWDAAENMEKLTAAALKVAAECWPKVKPEKVTILLKDDESDQAQKDGETIPELVGKQFLTATTKNAPQIMGPDKKPLPNGTEVRFGDTVRAVVQCIPSDTPKKSSITFRLIGVQLIEKRAGGSNDVSDLFDEEGEGFGETAPDGETSSGVDSGIDDGDLPF